jgi:hypothetical protein
MSATKTADVQLTERDRWRGDVVGATTETVTWGTHEFTVYFRQFDDGEGHIQVRAPSDPPPCADEIVADLRAGDALEQHVAAVLARAWELDTSWFAEVSR